MNARAEGMLGLCARARRVESGEDGCLRAIKSGRASLVLLDEAAGPNTSKSIKDACAYRKVPLMILEKGVLERTIGRSGRVTAALTDEGMAQRFRELADNAPAERKL